MTPTPIYNPVINPAFGTGQGVEIIAVLIANFLKIAFSISGLVLVVMLIWGSIQWMTAGGNKETLESAHQKVTGALIGFVVFISVFAIINFIAPAIGLEFLDVLQINWPTP